MDCPEPTGIPTRMNSFCVNGVDTKYIAINHNFHIAEIILPVFDRVCFQRNRQLRSSYRTICKRTRRILQDLLYVHWVKEIDRLQRTSRTLHEQFWSGKENETQGITVTETSICTHLLFIPYSKKAATLTVAAFYIQ